MGGAPGLWLVPDCCRRQLLEPPQPLGVQLEQRLAGRQADVVATLRVCGAQPRALPPRQQEHSQLALRPSTDLISLYGAVPLLQDPILRAIKYDALSNS